MKPIDIAFWFAIASLITGILLGMCKTAGAAWTAKVSWWWVVASFAPLALLSVIGVMVLLYAFSSGDGWH